MERHTPSVTEYVPNGFIPINPSASYTPNFNIPPERNSVIAGNCAFVNIPTQHHVTNLPIMVQKPIVPKTWTQQPNGRYVQTTVPRPGGVKKQKRMRTAFSSYQMSELEQEYARTKYLDRTRRLELSSVLNLNERTIKIWFQNRRMKEKKDRAESLEEIDEMIESPSEVMVLHEQYASNDVYRSGVYVERYSAGPTVPMPMQPAPVASVSYPTYSVPMNETPQYQPVHQYCPPTYTTVESPESTVPSESSSSNPSEPTVEKSWDWFKNFHCEDIVDAI